MPPAIVLRHLAKAYASPLTVPVAFGGVKTRGYYDSEAALVDDGTGGFLKHEQRVLAVMTGALPVTCKQNSRLVVDGTPFDVRAVLPFNDGLETRYVLAPVTA